MSMDELPELVAAADSSQYHSRYQVWNGAVEITNQANFADADRAAREEVEKVARSSEACDVFVTELRVVARYRAVVTVMVEEIGGPHESL